MRQRKQGFTLLELLVAMAIFGFIGVLSYGGFNSVLAAQKRGAERIQTLSELQRLFYLLQTDLSQAVGRPVRTQTGIQGQAFISGTAPDALLEMTRAGWVNPAQLQRSQLQRVAYLLEEEGLVRQYWGMLDRVHDEPLRRRLLLSNVARLTIRFLNSEGKWESQWPPASQQEDQFDSLPQAVEWVLGLKNWSGDLRWIFLVPHG